jgi:hypothetical protein
MKIEKPLIPNDAHSFEVFAIKYCDESPTGKQAFIGFKIENGDFHFIGVPFTEPNKESLNIPKYNLDELAHEWVFETNGYKWSNNDDTAGDNYGSFKAGFQKALELRGEIEEDNNKIKKCYHPLTERKHTSDIHFECTICGYNNY